MGKLVTVLFVIWVFLLAAVFLTNSYCGKEIEIGYANLGGGYVIARDGGIPFLIAGYAFAFFVLMYWMISRGFAGSSIVSGFMESPFGECLN